MTQSRKNFLDFWIEIRKELFLAHFKIIIRLPIAIFIAIVAIRLSRCAGFGADEILRQHECSVVLEPLVLLRTLFDFFPLMMKGIAAAMPFSFAAVLYLEWDKYKEDKPSGFTHWKGCEGYPGYTRRLKWVTADEWNIADKNIPAVSLEKRNKRYQGSFNEQDLLKSLRRKFARSENKPIEDTQDRIRWRIVQMNGREVHIDLQRKDRNPPTWVMTTNFFEWAGRKVPPSLSETHTSEFVAMDDFRSDNAI